MPEARAKPVVNIADVPMQENSHGDRFAARIGEVGLALGGTGIGCMYMEVPPGKRAFPFHAHRAQHEMFVILEGAGTYRFGDRGYPIKAGDVCAAPAGGAEFAHQIINDGTGVLKYLGLSSEMKGPKIVEYPDSGKFSVADWPGDGGFPTFHFVGRKDAEVSYWDGE